MSIRINDETQKLIETRMREGGFSTADELLQAVLGAPDAASFEALDEETLAAIDEAEEQVERGEVYDWREFREELRAKFLRK